MTNVTKTSEGTTAPATAGGERAGADAKRGEFDRVLDSKKDSRSEGRSEGASGKGEGGREAAVGDLLVRERRERRDGDGGGSGQGQGSSPEPQFRALPGDVAMATPIRWEPAPAAASGPARSAEMVARIEQIAQQIVQAAEITLGPKGTAEARLELNLGNLGAVHVSLTKGEDGALRIAFSNASAEGATALSTHASELLGRLEGRGLTVQEITVRGTDQADFRLAPTAPPQGGAPADAGQDESRRQQGYQDERQRRQRPDMELPDEEE